MLQIIELEEEQLGAVIEDKKTIGRKMEIPTYYFTLKASKMNKCRNITKILQ